MSEELFEDLKKDDKKYGIQVTLSWYRAIKNWRELKNLLTFLDLEYLLIFVKPDFSGYIAKFLDKETMPSGITISKKLLKTFKPIEPLKELM